MILRALRGAADRLARVRTPNPARRSAVTAVTYTIIGALPPYLTGALAVQLMSDLDFDRVHLGWSISAFYLVSSVVTARLGTLVEGGGPAAGLRAAAGCSLLSLLGIALVARSWWHVALFLGVGGLGNGFAQLSSNLALADGVPPGRQGVAFGVKQAAIPASSLVAGMSLPAVGLLAGWRWTLAAVSAVTVPALLRRPRLRRVSRPRSRRRIPWTATLALLAAAGAFAGGTSNSLTAFTVDAAVTAGLPEATAGLLLALGSMSAITTRVLSGHLADRSGTDGFARLTSLMFTGAAGFILLALAGGSLPLLAAGTLIGFSGGWGWQGLHSFITVRLYPATPAAASGMVFAGVFLGTIGGPPLIGALATAFSYRAAWLLSAALMATGATLALLARLAARRLATSEGPS